MQRAKSLHFFESLPVFYTSINLSTYQKADHPVSMSTLRFDVDLRNYERHYFKGLQKVHLKKQ